MFHLGWFVSFGASLQSWNETWSGQGGTEWMTPDLFVDLARAAERACLDCVMFEDTAMIPDVYGGSMEFYLKRGFTAPKHDPFPYLPLMGAATRHIGLAATASTSFYPPYTLARLVSTIDHLTGGRAGVNLVTSSSLRAMQNYGLEDLIPHATRYRMAEEWMEAVSALWESWDADALVMDEASGTYIDHTKVRPINFEGEFFKTRGPLNIVAAPQGRPVVFQAGGSPAGRAFGARHADIVMADAVTVDKMKSYRQNIRDLRTEAGLNPDHTKVLYLVRLFLGETEDEAKAKHQRYRDQEEADISKRMAGLSMLSGIDFSKFDPEQPLPEIETEGHRSVLMEFAARGKGKSLRELAGQANKLEIAGTPDSVAAQMGALMQEAGGDGFLILNNITRRMVAEVTDGLAPALQRRGLTRSSYNSTRFRENLRAF